jgi:drug/metabolite transporter (DMT)-like permease
LVFASALVIVAVLAGHPPGLEHVSVTGWIAAGVSGVLYYAAGFWCFLIGLRRSSAPVVAGFINLVPVFGLAASYLLLDERLTSRQLIGATVVIFAVAVVTMTPAASPAHIAAVNDQLGEGLRPD